MRLLLAILLASFAVSAFAFDHSVLAPSVSGELTPDEALSVCLGCHGGSSGGTPHALALGASHPMGFDYRERVRGRAKMNPEPGLFLFAGEISCLTCHDPLSQRPYILAVDHADGRALCQRCHSGY